jgi:hypothetical protein
MVGVVAIVCGCAGAAASALIIPPARSQNLPRSEYFCIHDLKDTDDFAAKMNQAGREGWELVGAGATPDYPTTNSTWCFKRPLR